jgi:hypothetical protein
MGASRHVREEFSDDAHVMLVVRHSIKLSHEFMLPNMRKYLKLVLKLASVLWLRVLSLQDLNCNLDGSQRGRLAKDRYRKLKLSQNFRYLRIGSVTYSAEEKVAGWYPDGEGLQTRRGRLHSPHCPHESALESESTCQFQSAQCVEGRSSGGASCRGKRI